MTKGTVEEGRSRGPEGAKRGRIIPKNGGSTHYLDLVGSFWIFCLARPQEPLFEHVHAQETAVDVDPYFTLSTHRISLGIQEHKVQCEGRQIDMQGVLAIQDGPSIEQSRHDSGSCGMSVSLVPSPLCHLDRPGRAVSL